MHELQILQKAYEAADGMADVTAAATPAPAATAVVATGVKQPRCHQGFAAAWDSVKHPVLALLADLLHAGLEQGGAGGAQQHVITCGHSLGGAIASHAACDIAVRLQVPGLCVSCYTFGCPRLGNRAFAAAYRDRVPDTWHVINDQDVVAHAMKLAGWYKRHGQRVLVNRHGDITVRPTYLEASLLQVRTDTTQLAALCCL